MARLLRLLPLVALLLLPAVPAGAATLFDQNGALAHAITALRARIGPGPLRVLKVEVAPQGVALQVQDRENPRHVDEWRFGRLDLKVWTYERITGPEPVPPQLLDPDLEANLFDLDGIDFAAAPRLAWAAIERAHLEDPGQVTGMEIARSVAILPRPTAGAVRWTVEVSSGRETASVYADGRGTIIGSDLSGTDYARTIDMTAAGGELVRAIEALKAAIPPDRTLEKVAIDDKQISIETSEPDKSGPFNVAAAGIGSFVTYRWTVDGLFRLAGGLNIGMIPGDPFAIADVDWTRLSRVEELARQSLAMPKGRITEVTVTKPTEGVGTPVVVWTVEIEDGSDKGSAVIDAKGAVLSVLLPESRRPPADWLDPATAIAGLARIGKEFGPGAGFSAISFEKEKIEITAPDPRDRNSFTSVRLDDKGFHRWGSPFSFYTANAAFTLDELKPLTAERLAQLEARTLARLKLPPGTVTDVTLSRGGFDPSPKGLVSLEIRAALNPPFGRDGRVVYDINGAVIKEYLPEEPAKPGEDNRPAVIRCSETADLDRRIAACTEVIDNPRAGVDNRNLAYTDRGLAYGRKGDYDRDIADETEAIKLDPHYENEFTNRGLAYHRKGDLAHALADYNEAVRLAPREALTYANRALLYLDQGDPDRAIADADEAIRLDAAMTSPRHTRGRAHFVKGDYDDAAADFSAALSADPGDAAGLGYRARVYLATGAYGQAIADDSAALALTPDRAPVLYDRGRGYLYSGQAEKAEADFRQALALDPREIGPALWLVLAERRGGEPNAAPTGPSPTGREWPAPLLRFFTGELSQAELIAAAADPQPATQAGRLCEANFYAGEAALAKGDKASAQGLLRAAAEGCLRGSIEWEGARAELAGLGAGP